MRAKLKNNGRNAVRMCVCVFVGCVAGLTVGILLEQVWSYAYWMGTHDPGPIYGLIGAEVLMIGMPMGLLIGVVTGTHHAIVRANGPKPFAWMLLTSTAAVGGLWASGFGLTNLPGYVLEVMALGLSTGWMTRKFAMEHDHGGRLETGRRLVMVSIAGSLGVIFAAVYAYFRLWLYLLSIPS